AAEHSKSASRNRYSTLKPCEEAYSTGMEQTQIRERARLIICAVLRWGMMRPRSTAIRLETALMAVSALLITRDRPKGISNTRNQTGTCGKITLNKATELSPDEPRPTKARPNKPIRKMKGATNRPPSKKPRRMDWVSLAA